VTSDVDEHNPAGGNPRPLPPGPLRRWPWLTFLLPFVVYMVFTTFEPTPNEPGGMLGLSIEYRHYPIVYTLKIAATLCAMLFVLPGYRTFPLRITPLAPLVGVIGVFLWIWLCDANLEEKTLVPLGLGSLIDMGTRPGFNPLEELAASPAWAYGFLAVRFLGLVCIVPILEEFFIRGFVMRLVVDHHWWEVPFGKVNATAVVLGGLVPMLSHPAEMFAALVWFSLVTLLMVRTRSMWDCVVAHAVTNLLLGIYVVWTGHWSLM
jgi:CAAX prenyl protease-like protein